MDESGSSEVRASELIGAHKPIENGVSNLVAVSFLSCIGLFVVFFISLLLVYIFTMPFWPQEPVIRESVAFTSAFFLTAMALGVLLKFWWPKLKDYWNKNVRGYTLWCIESDDGDEILTRVMAREISADIYDHFCIKIPLGGWFRKPGGVIDISKNHLKKFEITFKPPRTTMLLAVIIRDQGGTCCVFRSVTEAFDRLKEMNRSSTFNLFLKYFSWLAGRKEQLEADCVVAEERLKLMIDIAIETVERIDDSKRFIKSQQGEQIKKWLAQSILDLLPEDDHRTVSLHERLRTGEPFSLKPSRTGSGEDGSDELVETPEFPGSRDSEFTKFDSPDSDDEESDDTEEDETE